MLFFYVRRRTIPLLSTASYRQQLYQLDVPDELLSLIEHEYGWKPKLFLPRLYDGRLLVSLSCKDLGQPEPDPEEISCGREYFLIFAQVALRSCDTLSSHLTQQLQAALDLVESLKNDGFNVTVDRISSRLAATAVTSPVLAISSETVDLALKNAETLIKTDGARAAVDRVHTAFHGYLQAICQQESIAVPSDAGIMQLLKAIRGNHSKLKASIPGADEVGRIIRNLSATLDALNPIRNHKTLAHPTNTLLEEPEAMLIVNTVRTLLHYLNDRLT